jgi:hypothetical protein
MNYAIEMGSGAMIYTPSFTKIGSTIRKLIGGGDTQTVWRLYTSTRRHTPEDGILHSHHRENLKSYICINLLLFFSK